MVHPVATKQPEATMQPDLPDEDYLALARFRRMLRGFLAFSAAAARAEGIHPAQHQLMLAVRGFEAAGTEPSTGDLAEALSLRLHSAGELVERARANGLVERHADPADGRRVLVQLTDQGRTALTNLSQLHREELRRFRTEALGVLQRLGD